MGRVRHHPDALIDALLDWCEANAREQAEAVVAVGLAYVHGLNAHQIAATTIKATGESISIEYPCRRRAAEIALAERATIVLDEPHWLAQSATVLTEEADRLAPGALLYRTRRRLNVPLGPGYVRKRVAEAGRAACGMHVSCKTLNDSRIAAVRREGLVFALFGSGYANSWAARLGAAEFTLLLPRRTA
jgi:hypothetical protein